MSVTPHKVSRLVKNGSGLKLYHLNCVMFCCHAVGCSRGNVLNSHGSPLSLYGMAQSACSMCARLRPPHIWRMTQSNLSPDCHSEEKYV